MATATTALRNGLLNAFDDLCNAGTGTGAFFIFETVGDGAVAACDMSASAAFAAASGASMTANAIGTALAASAATLAQVSIYDTDSTKLIELTLGTAAEEVVVNSTTVASGATVTVSSLVVTCPAS